MADWYKDHNISPEAAGDKAYRDWAQDNGLYVDVAGNVSDPREVQVPDDLDDDPRLWTTP